jgi:hypothetical protein
VGWETEVVVSDELIEKVAQAILAVPSPGISYNERGLLLNDLVALAHSEGQYSYKISDEDTARVFARAAIAALRAKDLPVVELNREGCQRPLAPYQWWAWCGETDMGQTAPALCTECGGDLKLATPRP